MTGKPLLPLILLLLGAPLHAQDASPPATLQTVTVRHPSMKPLLEALVHSRLNHVATRVLLEWDADGHVLQATVDPSTHDSRLDEAIRAYALQLQLAPGQAGRDWLPIEFSLN